MPNRELMNAEERAQDDKIGEIAKRLTGAQVDTLVSAVESGPVWVGDLPSKTARNELVDMSLLTHIVSKMEEGYTASTMLGAAVYRKLFGNSDSNEEARKVRKLGQVKS